MIPIHMIIKHRKTVILGGVIVCILLYSLSLYRDLKQLEIEKVSLESKVKVIIAENETLQLAIKNQAKKSKGKTIIKNGAVLKTRETKKSPTEEIVIETFDTVPIEYVNEKPYETKPVVPEMESQVNQLNVNKVSRFSLIGIYNGNVGGGITYKPFKRINFQVGAGYIEAPALFLQINF